MRFSNTKKNVPKSFKIKALLNQWLLKYFDVYPFRTIKTPYFCRLKAPKNI